MSKQKIRAALMKQIGEGRSMISSAEFRYMFGDITLEQCNTEIRTGNKLLMDALDQAEAKGVRLPW